MDTNEIGSLLKLFEAASAHGQMFTSVRDLALLQLKHLEEEASKELADYRQAQAEKAAAEAAAKAEEEAAAKESEVTDEGEGDGEKPAPRSIPRGRFERSDSEKGSG